MLIVWPEKLKCFKVNLSDMFPCCCCSAMACMQCCLGVWQKDGGQCSGWWLKAEMNSSDVTFLRTSQGLVKRHSYFMQAVSFTVDWLFWNLYGSYIAPRPLLSWKKIRKFQFWQYGTFKDESVCQCARHHSEEMPGVGGDVPLHLKYVML